MSDTLDVTVIPDGPLKISGASELRYCGQPLEADGDVYLCRCGDSSSAPFCDGTHRKVGFQGASPQPPEAEVRVWEGQAIRTRFNTAACMHVFYCKPLKELRAREERGDLQAAAEIARVVSTCPSGALTYELKQPGVPRPAAPQRPAVDIVEGGEVRLQAPFSINAALHAGQPDDRATLCRCGRSKNKPWCDGRHKGRKDFR